jgi:hypothetical protein
MTRYSRLSCADFTGVTDGKVPAFDSLALGPEEEAGEVVEVGVVVVGVLATAGDDILLLINELK